MRYVHESDLRWFLDGSREAALGKKSNHASFVARLEGSTGTDAEAATAAEERMVEAVRKERRIADVLYRCTHRAQEVLTGFYRPDKLVVYWKELTHVLPLCEEYVPAKHGPVDGSIALRMGLGNPKDDQKGIALMLRRVAETAVGDAMREYEGIFAAAAEKGRAA